MSIELIQEWVDIFTAKGGKLVAPREIRELAANNTKYKVYEWLYNKAAHTAGWQPFEQGLRKGKLYLQRGELIASIRRIAKGCRLSLSQTHAVVAFLVGHWFIEQRT